MTKPLTFIDGRLSIASHEDLRGAIAVAAERRGLSVSQFASRARVSSMARFADGANRSVLIEPVLLAFHYHKYELLVHPLTAEGDDPSAAVPHKITDSSSLRSSLRSLIAATGQAPSTVSKEAGATTSMHKYVMHPDEAMQIQAMVVFRVWEHLGATVTLRDLINGRRAR